MKPAPFLNMSLWYNSPPPNSTKATELLVLCTPPSIPTLFQRISILPFCPKRSLPNPQDPPANLHKKPSFHLRICPARYVEEPHCNHCAELQFLICLRGKRLATFFFLFLLCSSFMFSLFLFSSKPVIKYFRLFCFEVRRTLWMKWHYGCKQNFKKI